MWIQSKKVVKETEKASLKGKSKVIPGTNLQTSKTISTDFLKLTLFGTG